VACLTAAMLAYLRLPWPEGAFAIWTAVLLVAGRSVATVRIGPVYATEAVLGFAMLGLALRWATVGGLGAAIRRFPSVIERIGLLVLAGAFVWAFTRGIRDYGTGALHDAGLGYPVVAAPIALALVGTRARQDAVLRLLYLAGVVGTGVLVVRNQIGSDFGQTSLAVGFVIFIPLAPIADDWLRGRAGPLARLYLIVALAGALVLNMFPSRSGILGLVVGLLVVLSLSLHRRAVRVGTVIAALAITGGALLAYGAEPALVTENHYSVLAHDTVTLAPTNKGSNARWRLDYADTLLGRSLAKPATALAGVGFGPASHFVFNGDHYDFRDGPGGLADPTVSGPHNALVDIIYRMGWPAALALLGILTVTFTRARRALHFAGPADARALRVLISLASSGIVVALTSDALRGPQMAIPITCVFALLAARAASVGRQYHRAPRA
jgi:hypothetical protein